jgi:hypothetical protein
MTVVKIRSAKAFKDALGEIINGTIQRSIETRGFTPLLG